ncbi:MAG TPA: pectate lyase [Polyangiaceae bacterium]
MSERKFVGAAFGCLLFVVVACGSSAPDGAGTEPPGASPSSSSSNSSGGGPAGSSSGSKSTPDASAPTGNGSSGSSSGAASSSGGSSSGGSARVDAGSSSSSGSATKGDAGGAATPDATAADAQADVATVSPPPPPPSITQSASCKVPTWPTAVGSTVNISGTKEITGVYDGKMALHEGNLNDCTTGDQSSTTPIMEVADGGTVKNVVFGTHVGDGIHCLGSCTIDNVWFPFICDDAVTMLGGSGKTMTLTNSGFKNARDKTIQHNGDGSTVVIDTVYSNVAGKLYRSCGQGCSSSAKRTAKISNVIAIGVDQVAGVSTNDHVTLSNICTYQSGQICKTYQPGSETESTAGANGTPEGPDANCTYVGSDSHGLISDVTGGFQSDVLCPGPNSVKVGSTNATACVASFETCLKGCAPGSYGFRQVNCPAGSYASDGPCALPADPTIAAHLGAANAPSAAAMTVTSNDPCTTEWQWANDGAGKFCVCVMKPGYYQASSGWFVWDCQSQWW